MARCVVTRRLVGHSLTRLATAHDVTTWPGELPPTPDELIALSHDADGILCLLTDRIDAAFLDACPRLKVVSNYAVGTDNVDLAAAAERGIPVGNTPDVLTDATADLTFALLLALARRLPEAARAVTDGEWRTWEPARWLGSDVSGATLGLVGYGRIGQAVARRAAGFGMEVLHTTRNSGTPLRALLERSDIVSLHAPLTDATRHLIDRDRLRGMKPTALLVNTARGGLVDHEALADALRDGTIAGAALDVTEPEPLPATHPLLAAPNLLVVPHVGSATLQARSRMTELAVGNLLAGLAGLPLPHRAA